MRVRLLGTGSADGWPNPFCTCASCTWARATGTVRGQSATLVDGTVLLDCGPEVPRAAERLGEPLSGVRHLLLTHAHPDHTGPAALMWRGWVQRTRPLDVWGPPAAVAACRDWLGPDDPVVLHEVRAGDRLDLGAHRALALPAAHADATVGPAVLYDLTGPDGARLLYATDTGPLPDAAVVAGADYDLVLMELTFGTGDGTGVGHLDLRTWPAQLARLRAAGAVTPRTVAAPTHLGHRNPPGPELAATLGDWGARLVGDGDELVVGPEGPPPTPRPPHRVLVTGGARSGKSAHAEDLLRAEPAVTYVATSAADGDDAEWAERIAVHRGRRPAHWRTVEAGADLPALLRDADGPVLVDCLTLWLTGALDRHRGWDGGEGWQEECDELVEALRGTAARAVVVTNEVGAGVVPATPAGRLFRDALGRLNARVAAECDEVRLVTAGLVQRLR